MRRARMLWEAFVTRFEDALERYRKGRLSGDEAGELLGMSGRNFRRLCVRYEDLCQDAPGTLPVVKQAIADINESAGDLFVVSGKRTQRVDTVTVFVVFSVAGGTGSGIYYDYLHLIEKP